MNRSIHTRLSPGLASLLLAGLLGLAAGTAVAQTTHAIDIIDGQAFTPSQLTIQVGDTVRWTNRSSGTHNVQADDDSFNSGRPAAGRWTFSHTFSAPGEFGYFCLPHGGAGGVGMSGKVIVQGEAPPPANDFVINEGVSGSWFNPATNGQGILLEASAELGLVAFAWFTWTADGGYDWLTGNGPIEGPSAMLDVYRSSGGRFNNGAFTVNSVVTGEAILTFTDCSNATFTWSDPTLPAAGEMQLVRILPPPAACLEANGATATQR